MNKLVNVPKNRNLGSKKSEFSIPSWSRWIDDIFDNELPSIFTENESVAVSVPKANIRETEDAFSVEMAIPGLKKSDINIELNNQALTISSEIDYEDETKDDKFNRIEYNYSKFSRTFSLPETVDESKIDATYKDGVLSINLPKKEEAKKKMLKTIHVK